MKNYENIVKAFTEAIITILGSNFKANLEEGTHKYVVGIYLPRRRDFGPFKGAEP